MIHDDIYLGIITSRGQFCFTLIRMRQAACVGTLLSVQGPRVFARKYGWEPGKDHVYLAQICQNYISLAEIVHQST